MVFMVAPFVWMLLSSVKPKGEIIQSPPTWLPNSPTWDNYTTLFTKLDLTTFFMNSVIVAVAVTLGNLVFCSMLGYALAKLDFAGRRLLFAHRARHVDDPGRRDLRPDVRSGIQPAPDQQPARHDPAVPGAAVRRLLDAPVHRRPARRADPGGACRRGRGVPDLLERHPAAVRAGARHARHLDVPRLLEQLPVAARRGAAARTSSRCPWRWRCTRSARTPPNYGLLLAGSVVVVLPVIAVFLALQRYFIQGISMTGIK